MTICEVVQSYLNHLYRMQKKSARHSHSHAKPVLAWCAYAKVEDFDAVQYQSLRKDAGVKPATINRELEVLKQAARHWNRMRLPAEAVTLRHIPRLPENNVRQGFFEHADWHRLSEHLPWWLVGFCDFAYYTGWRKSEIAGLKWSDIYFDKEGSTVPTAIRIGDSKNGEGRVIPVAGPIRAVLSGALYNRITSSPWVFHDPAGNKIRDFRKRWLTACKAAGFAVAPLFHDFRRTAVRNMIEAGIDREVAKKITGHKTDSMFARYQIVDQRQMTAALEKL